MKSPFKFLDAYTPEDSKAFFGRDNEIEQLYNLIYKSRLLLVYGQSGTGKTSLVQCGLGSRFDDTDWFPFLIRRNDNINSSLSEALAKPAGGSLRKNSIPETIAYVYKNHLRPVYLIFDQLEELFILGKEAEQKEFINTISEILKSELPCKILLVMREEYIAHLYRFEQTIPSLFDRRMRVEPMSYSNVKSVITGSCEQFNITLEEEEGNVKKIIDQVSGGRSGIQLPYLQVYLDRLWREDFDRTFPNGYTTANDTAETDEKNAAPASKSSNKKNTSSAYPPLKFTTKEIEDLGEIEEVLEKFLRQQVQDIQHKLKETYPVLPEDAIRQILDIFVSEEGTKQPIQYLRKDGNIVLEASFGKKLGQLPGEAVEAALNNLEHARILRFTENLIELAHDSLADLIDKERSTEQRQLNQVKRRVGAAYVEQKETGVFLNDRQLLSIEEFLPRLHLEPHIQQFIEDSKSDAAKKSQEEKARHQRELKLTKEKLVAEQRAAKRQRMLSWVMGLAFVASLILGGISYYLNQQKRDLEISAEIQKLKHEEKNRIMADSLEKMRLRNLALQKKQQERKNPQNKPITLQYIKDAPLKDLIKPRADIDKIIYVDDAGRQNYMFKLWLDMPKIRQDDISEVRYFFNHPTFYPKVKEWGDERFGGHRPDFAIIYQGFSCLQNVQVWITPKNSSTVDTLYLSMCNALNEAR